MNPLNPRPVPYRAPSGAGDGCDREGIDLMAARAMLEGAGYRFVPLAPFAVWHRDHRRPVVPYAPSLASALASALHDHRERGERAAVREPGLAEYEPRLAGGDPAPAVVVGPHYDSPPLAVGQVDHAALEPLRAAVAGGISPHDPDVAARAATLHDDCGRQLRIISGE